MPFPIRQGIAALYRPGNQTRSVILALGFGVFLIGSGRDVWTVPAALRMRFHELKLNVETTRTGNAVSTYNILLGEGRRVAAGLIAVE